MLKGFNFIVRYIEFYLILALEYRPPRLLCTDQAKALNGLKNEEKICENREFWNILEWSAWFK